MREIMSGGRPGGAVVPLSPAPDMDLKPRLCVECQTEHHNPKLKFCRRCRANLPPLEEVALTPKTYKETLLAKGTPVHLKQAHVPVAIPKQLKGVQKRHGLELPPTPNEKEEEEKQEVAKQDYAT